MINENNPIVFTFNFTKFQRSLFSIFHFNIIDITLMTPTPKTYPLDFILNNLFSKVREYYYEQFIFLYINIW